MFESAITKNKKVFDLTSPVNVAKDNGVITGSPTFSRRGIDLDGSNDYVTYSIPNTLMSSAKISIVIEFTPDFALDDGLNHGLIDTTGSARYLFYKISNGDFGVFLGGSNIGSILESTYSAYWKIGERNVMVISGTSGDTSVWLNGVQIMDSDISFWSPRQPVELFIGAFYSGNFFFDGDIHSVSIKNDLTTAQEALDLYNRSTFNFKNKADVYLDMKSQVGKASGTELIVGGMTAGGYTPGSNGALTNPTADILRVAYVDTNDPLGYQNILASGKRYRARGKARGDGTAKPSVGNWLDKWIGTTNTDWQDFDIIFTYDTNGIFYLKATTTGASYAEFKDVSVELVQQTTPDKSGKGNDFLLGDGSDTTKMPSFENPGFTVAAGDNLTNPSAVGIYNNAEQSIVICFKPDFNLDIAAHKYFFDSTVGTRYMAYHDAGGTEVSLYLGNTFVGASIGAFPYWNAGGTNVLVIAGTTGNTSMWLNGSLIMDADNTAWSPGDTATIYLSSSNAGAAVLEGTYYHFSTYARKLTPTQARDITNLLMREYS